MLLHQTAKDVLHRPLPLPSSLPEQVTEPRHREYRHVVLPVKTEVHRAGVDVRAIPDGQLVVVVAVVVIRITDDPAAAVPLVAQYRHPEALGRDAKLVHPASVRSERGCRLRSDDGGGITSTTPPPGWRVLQFATINPGVMRQGALLRDKFVP